jgi:hypothetical protein
MVSGVHVVYEVDMGFGGKEVLRLSERGGKGWEGFGPVAFSAGR